VRLAGLAGYADITVSVGIGAQARRADGLAVTGNDFSLLRVRPALGRFVTPEEDVGPGSPPVVVMSHAYWCGELGGDSAVLGTAKIARWLALATVLLVGAGLFVHSLRNVQAIEPGIVVDHLLVASIDLEGTAYRGPAAAQFLQRAAERVRHVPGVRGVALSSQIPLGGGARAGGEPGVRRARMARSERDRAVRGHRVEGQRQVLPGGGRGGQREVREPGGASAPGVLPGGCAGSGR
jgi:hypothetical protein